MQSALQYIHKGMFFILSECLIRFLVNRIHKLRFEAQSLQLKKKQFSQSSD